MTRAEQQVHLKKIIDDTERRLNILFDGLNNETVPKDAVNQMNNIAKGESWCLFWLTRSYGRERCKWSFGNACSAVDERFGRDDGLGGEWFLENLGVADSSAWSEATYTAGHLII